MHKFLRKLGMGRMAASFVMIAFGVLVIIYPDLLAQLIAAYLIIVGLIKLISD